MTLEEVNAKIKALEKEIRELKQIKRDIQGVDTFKAESEEWLQKARLAIDNCRNHTTLDQFYSISLNVPSYGIIHNVDSLYRFGIQTGRLRHGWRGILARTIHTATNGRCSGMINKQTRAYQLTDEEVAKTKELLHKRIDDWCSKWEVKEDK